MTLTYEIQHADKRQARTDAVWNNIRPLHINHYLWEDNGYKPEVEVRLYYTAEHLFVQFRTYETNPTITYYQMNEDVFKDSCVEFFVQPSPDMDERYLNFETNAAGTLLLGLGAGRKRNRLTNVDPSLFDIQTTTGLQDADTGKVYWKLEYAIPFAFVKQHFPDFEAKKGAKLRANFYKCGEDVPEPHFGCWNLIESDQPDFHVSQFFGHLVLA